MYNYKEWRDTRVSDERSDLLEYEKYLKKIDMSPLEIMELIENMESNIPSNPTKEYLQSLQKYKDKLNEEYINGK